MNTIPRNPETVKMEQNDVKINLDSADTKTQLANRECFVGLDLPKKWILRFEFQKSKTI